MPQRIGNLWPALVSFENLLLAHSKARRGKRDRPEVAAFEYELERGLLRLQRELEDRTYRPGTYRTFTIREPKERLISAAPFRDRVVHHALMNVLEPVLDARMSFDSYACRKGKGTHAALDRYTHFARRFKYAWHGDIRKFFPSIDHAILKTILRRIVKDEAVC
jgi:retron-type reverse transcriptase